MESHKLNNLCSHYKNTYGIHQSCRKQRDNIFLLLLISLSIFSLQFSSAEITTELVSEYLAKTTGAEIGDLAYLVDSILWLYLLGVSTKYYQLVLEIDRQYDYLKILELEINKEYPGTKYLLEKVNHILK